MESRLITLNSEDAQKINGEYNSNLFFNIPNIVDENPDISHLEVSLDSATIPVSWYLINDLTNTLSYVYNSIPFTLTLTKGNYNGSTMITELTNKFSDNGLVVVITLSQVTGLLLFKFANAISPVDFIYNTGLMRILGFTQSTSGVAVVPQLPMNLLGIQKINICSGNLASISSFSSSPALSNSVIQSIPIDVPSFHQITYLASTNHYGRMKSRFLSNIDIQLLDEFGRFIEMNGIEFTLSFVIRIFRKYRVEHDTIKIPKAEEKEEKKELKEEDKEEEGKDDELELLSQK
jgi:hypothetical protein